MKKVSLLSVLFVMFSAVSLTSCDSEPVDPVLNSNDPDGDGDGDGNGGGVYWPMAVGNIWEFEMDGEAQDPMEITDTEEINGKTYYKMNQSFTNAGMADFTGDAEAFINYDDGDYSVRVSVEIAAGDGMPAITIEPYEFIIFREGLSAGETWNQTVTQTTIMDLPGVPPMENEIDIEGTIMEEDITMEVNGTTYEHVVKSKFVQTMMGEEIVTYYWFAKDVGPIRIQSTAEGAEFDQTLVSYELN